MDPLDLLDTLTELEITVAWVQTMAYAALYMPRYRIVVLNAECCHRELSEALCDVLPELRSQP